MCGIVGAIAERNVTPILLEGLRRLEYRGYDSAGIVTLDQRDQRLHRTRTVGKVQALAERLRREPVRGSLGIARSARDGRAVSSMKSSSVTICETWPPSSASWAHRSSTAWAARCS